MKDPILLPFSSFIEKIITFLDVNKTEIFKKWKAYCVFGGKSE